MAKCTGLRCPMQVGYKVDECDYKDCPCRTEPITNADRIRAMSDEELAEIIACPKGLFDRMDCFDDNRDCKHCALEWLKQHAE